MASELADEAIAPPAGGSASAAGTVNWYLSDKDGSVRDVVDANGNELQHIRYDQYGNVIAVNGAAPSDSYLGQYPQEQSGLVSNGSFENGLTDWSVAAGSSGTATVIVPDSQSYPLMPDNTTHAVEVSTSGSGSTTLSQTDGTVSAGSTYVLELYQTTGPTGDDVEYQVQLMAGSTAIATTVVDSQDSDPADSGNWMGVQISGSVAAGSSLAGQPLTIQLTAVGAGGSGGSMLFDDVKLSQWTTSPQANSGTNGGTAPLSMPQYGFQGMRWDGVVGLYDDMAKCYDLIKFLIPHK